MIKVSFFYRDRGQASQTNNIRPDGDQDGPTRRVVCGLCNKTREKTMVTNSMNLSNSETRPLTSLESKLIGVLQGGPLTRDQIVKRLSIPRTTVYDGLTKLMARNEVVKYPDYGNGDYLGRGRPSVLFSLFEPDDEPLPPLHSEILGLLRDGQPRTRKELYAHFEHVHSTNVYHAISHLLKRRFVTEITRYRTIDEHFPALTYIKISRDERE